MLAIALSAVPGRAMPIAPAPAAPPVPAVAQVQFLGGPFFGRHGYYQPDPAKRHYFYEGYDPSLNPYKKKVRRHRYARRRYRHR